MSLDKSGHLRHKVGPTMLGGDLAMAPRMLNKLSAKKVERLTTPGRHSDGGGLFLSIDKGGRRRWVFLYTRHGRRVELGLGGGRDLPLAAARTEAATLRAALASGQDPKIVRSRDDHIPIFGEFADGYVEAMLSGWRNPKHIAQ
jgi:Arm DNA-binding domain